MSLEHNIYQACEQAVNTLNRTYTEQLKRQIDEILEQQADFSDVCDKILQVVSEAKETFQEEARKRYWDGFLFYTKEYLTFKSNCKRIKLRILLNGYEALLKSSKIQLKHYFKEYRALIRAAKKLLSSEGYKVVRDSSGKLYVLMQYERLKSSPANVKPIRVVFASGERQMGAQRIRDQDEQET